MAERHGVSGLHPGRIPVSHRAAAGLDAKPFSYLLAPYWAARVLHATANGSATPQELALSWGMMALFGTLYLVFSRYLLRVIQRKARADATLGLE